MTKKRFYTEGRYVMQDKEVYVICNGEHSADVVSTALNELLEENKQLKQDRNEMFIRERDAQNELRDIRKENELLKHENEHLNICLMIEAMYDTSEIELTKCIAKNEQLKQSNQVLSDMCDEYLSSKDFLEHENEWLKKEHKRIQNKVCRLLNHLCDVEGCITREQAKEWWNNEIGDLNE